MAKAFDLLNKNLKNYIYQQGWQKLMPIQAVAIEHSHKNDHNFILSAQTISGKTEAAFLPAINAVENFYNGVKIIYVSPQLALMNRQYKRLFKLCTDLGIPITNWHGEMQASEKQKILDKPMGIIVVTPEYLEEMLAVKRNEAIRLFNKTEWLIVDELHAFLLDNRGVQLRSILERMQSYYQKQPRYVGIAAVLNPADFGAAKEFFNSSRKTDIIVDSSKNSFSATIDYFRTDEDANNDRLLKRLFELSLEKRLLIFPDSYQLAEKLTAELKDLALERGSDALYFCHKNSVGKDARLRADNFSKIANDKLFTIFATNTLDLGVDIGSVDSIVQCNAPFSASLLAQRLARSGNSKGENHLHLMATEEWSLLQALASIELYRLKKLERSFIIAKPFDVLAQQILSILIEYSSVDFDKLCHINSHLASFNKITDDEVKRLFDHLIAREYIELVDDVATVGSATRTLLEEGEFYNYYRVNNAEEIDNQFSTFAVSSTVREKMKDLVYGGYDNFPKEINAILSKLRAQNRYDGVQIFAEEDDNILWRTFAGTKVNRTLQLMLNLMSASSDYQLDDHKTAIWGKDIKVAVSKLIQNPPDKIDVYHYLKQKPDIVRTMLSANKHADLLPFYLQISYAINVYLDIEGTLEFLSVE